MKGNLVILSNSLKMHEPKNLLPKESIMDMYKDLAVSCLLLLETNRTPNNRRAENYIYSPYNRVLKNNGIEMTLTTFRDVHTILLSNKYKFRLVTTNYITKANVTMFSTHMENDRGVPPKTNCNLFLHRWC